MVYSGLGSTPASAVHQLYIQGRLFNAPCLSFPIFEYHKLLMQLNEWMPIRNLKSPTPEAPPAHASSLQPPESRRGWDCVPWGSVTGRCHLPCSSAYQWRGRDPAPQLRSHLLRGWVEAPQCLFTNRALPARETCSSSRRVAAAARLREGAAGDLGPEEDRELGVGSASTLPVRHPSPFSTLPSFQPTSEGPSPSLVPPLTSYVTPSGTGTLVTKVSMLLGRIKG